MGNIDVKLVKELRERTQAGFADCQKALAETNNDLDAAIAWLKEKGAVKAEKKAGAIAAEGITHVIKKGNKALIIEINSQTDFVAKNDDFKKLAAAIEETVFDSGVVNKEQVDELVLANGKTIKEACIEATAKIGEKISYRRGEIIQASADDETIGVYAHHNGKFASAVVIKGKSNETVANDVAMHVGAMNPKFLNVESVDQVWLNDQKEDIRKKAIIDFEEKGKDIKHIDKTVDGRVNKLLAEFSLEKQAFAKEPSMTVEKYILSNGDAKLIYMQRFELGEGIQRKEENFAAEVAAQMNVK